MTWELKVDMAEWPRMLTYGNLGLSLNFLWSGGKEEGIETPGGIPPLPHVPPKPNGGRLRPESVGRTFSGCLGGREDGSSLLGASGGIPRVGGVAPVSLLLTLDQAS